MVFLTCAGRRPTTPSVALRLPPRLPGPLRDGPPQRPGDTMTFGAR